MIRKINESIITSDRGVDIIDYNTMPDNELASLMVEKTISICEVFVDVNRIPTRSIGWRKRDSHNGLNDEDLWKTVIKRFKRTTITDYTYTNNRYDIEYVDCSILNGFRVVLYDNVKKCSFVFKVHTINDNDTIVEVIPNKNVRITIADYCKDYLPTLATDFILSYNNKERAQNNDARNIENNLKVPVYNANVDNSCITVLSYIWTPNEEEKPSPITIRVNGEKYNVTIKYIAGTTVGIEAEHIGTNDIIIGRIYDNVVLVYNANDVIPTVKKVNTKPGTIRGYDESAGVKMVAFGPWVDVNSNTAKAVNELIKQANFAMKKTGAEFMTVDYLDTPPTNDPIEFMDELVNTYKGDMRVGHLRVALISGELVVADDDTCSFEDDEFWDEDNEVSWNECDND